MRRDPISLIATFGAPLLVGLLLLSRIISGHWGAVAFMAITFAVVIVLYLRFIRLAVTIYDPVHSDEEDRYIALGESQRQRLLVVVFTDRDDRIRVISARIATPRERKDYEKGR
jgi:uncharacterized DUF497 family protein